MSDFSREWAEYDSGSAHKLLCENRDRYIAQSAATRGGVVAPIDPTEPVHPSTTTGRDCAQRNSAA